MEFSIKLFELFPTNQIEFSRSYTKIPVITKDLALNRLKGSYTRGLALRMDIRAEVESLFTLFADIYTTLANNRSLRFGLNLEVKRTGAERQTRSPNASHGH